MRIKALACVLVGLMCLTAVAGAPAKVNNGDPTLDWNFVLLELNRFDHALAKPDQGGPTRSARAFAMVHTAMYDAFVSADGVGTPYLMQVPFGKGASKEAAVATAARITLLSLYPSQKPLIEQCYNDYLATLPAGGAKTLGQMVGSITGNLTLLVRQFDGKTLAEQITYTPTGQPGNHDVDPLNPKQGFLTPGWGMITPFGITNAHEFRASPPPSLSSSAYAEAFHEVKSFGQDVSTSRTAEQTQIGIFWGYDGAPNLGVPPRLYFQIVRTLAAKRGTTPRENARLFTLVAIAMADSGIVTWNDKYTYKFWRPIRAIRAADLDNNPRTTKDASWSPLGAPASNRIAPNFTPNFPAYASGHASFGSAALQTCIRFFGKDDIPFDFTSDEFNGVTTDNQGKVRPVVTRHYARLSDAIQENAISRIYLGIHWRFDALAGIKQGTAIANRIFETKLR